MKKTLSAVIMSAVMLIGVGVHSTATAAEYQRDIVIDDELKEVMSSTSSKERISVSVDIPDIAPELTVDQITLENAVELLQSGKECPPIFNLRLLYAESDIDVDTATAQLLIKHQRESYAKLYEEQNAQFVDKYLDGYNVSYVSRYFPTVLLDLTPIEINRLALKSAITSISVGDVEPETTEIAAVGTGNAEIHATTATAAEVSARYQTASNLNKTYRDKLGITEVQNLGFTGEGIKVGVVELGLPDKSYWSVLGLNSNKVFFSSNSTSSYEANDVCHAVNVIFEIKQIAPKADIYVSSYKLEYFEKLIDECVTVINCSSSTSRTTTSDDKQTKVIDAFVYKYGITIVSSSGNYSTEAQKHNLSDYAAGYNVIAVGNVNPDLEIKDNSCYSLNSNTNMAYRPDLCAIGYTNYLCPDKYGKLYGDGTSFASPRVAGSIALLMEYNSDLLFSPTLSKAVISVATNTTTAQYSLTNAEEKAGYEKYGAGILNCYNAYRVLKNGTYDDLHTGSPGTLDFSKTLSLSTGQTLRVAVADMIPCSYTSRYNENHKEYVYSGEYGILPDIVVSVMGKNSVSIREQTTSLHVVEYTVTRVGGNQLRIKSVTPINDILLCSYAYVIE